MKTKILILVANACLSLCLKAQFQFVPLTVNQYGSTVGTISGIGIGNWPTTTPTNAALHINSNLLVFPANFQPGEVFITDCPTGSVTDPVTGWRMLRNGTQLFNINNPYSGNDIYTGTVQSGDLRFFTNGYSGDYMRIDGSANPGYVGIGNSFTPQYLLDVDGTIAAKKILIKTNGKVQDLFALVEELQTQIIELKSQLAFIQTNSK